MRPIEYIVVHCTAGNPQATVEDLRAHFRALGWSRPGYHYVVTADGTVHRLLREELPSNGVRGRNRTSIHVAYTGGIDAQGRGIDTRTLAQRMGLRSLLSTLKSRYPTAEILGHRDFPGVAKACPCFDARREYADLMLEGGGYDE